ncbi:MAG: hypothetical protein CL519_04740 [Actinobacteria bacterium]|nr:hypothetical protein [Actinomycetota bacterium]
MAREIFRQTLPDGKLVISLISDSDDGDFSVAQQPENYLAENQRKLYKGEWNWLTQEHGTEIVWLEDDERSLGITGDALATISSQKVIAITVADCLPLLLIEQSGILSLMHLGWRGIEGGLLEKTLQFIRSKSSESITAVLGPCIDTCCYEFGQNELRILVEKYGEKIVGRTNKGSIAFDMRACVKEILKSSNVEIKYEEDSCTKCDSRYWSFRADGTGKRQVMIAWKQEND